MIYFNIYTHTHIYIYIYITIYSVHFDKQINKRKYIVEYIQTNRV